jgi:hypothetical protein
MNTAQELDTGALTCDFGYEWRNIEQDETP